MNCSANCSAMMRMMRMMRSCSGAAMCSSLLCLALAADLCAFGQASAPAPQYQITGVLVSSTDGSPVPHGHLEATLAGTGRQAGQRLPAGENGADTDDQGRFLLPLPSQGLWDLIATARGFVRQGYQEHEQFMTAVVLTPAEPAMDIRFALSPNAEIRGMLTDEAGEAVRGAQVFLMKMTANVPGSAEPPMLTRSFATTDDRGMYEFDNLAPGKYKICVQAQPWYAVAARQRRNLDRDPPLDPSLDVAYQATWFPGVDRPDQAETLALRSGDVRDADVRLTPVPSLHILVDPPPSAVSGVSRGVPYIPSVRRIDSSAVPAVYVQPGLTRNAQGQIDVSGLTSGLYDVQIAAQGNEARHSVVRVAAGGAQTVSFDADSGEAEVGLHITGLLKTETGSLRVVLVDPENRQAMASLNMGGFPGASDGTRNNAPDAREHPRTLAVPAGRYEVVILGRPDLFLTGIEAKGAKATGRSVTLPAGASSLTLHVAEGRASLTGLARFNGKPSVGAVVMLVPATLGETGALQIVRRDQSNSDGSFNIARIIPGQYILIAVEDGWGINWADASTMRRYLIQGVALDIGAGSDVTQNVTAQEP